MSTTGTVDVVVGATVDDVVLDVVVDAVVVVVVVPAVVVGASVVVWSSFDVGAALRRLLPRELEQLLELVLGTVLGTRILDPGAPQLVGDKAEHQQPDDDQRLAEQAHEPAQIAGARGPVPARRAAHGGHRVRR